jgi:predicted transcriptional regulator
MAKLRRMTVPPPIADQLRQAIRESGRSMNDIAKAADVAVSSVHKFLHGGNVNLATAEALAKAIGRDFSIR